jgi:hypothetical protein
MRLEAFLGKLNHLNLEKAPARSTLADANMNRSSEVFRMIYNHLKEQYKLSLSDSTLPKSVLNNLLLIDSTVFGLFKVILKTSGRNRLDGKRKGCIMKNTVLEASTLMPVLINFNAAADNDQQFLKYIDLPSGSYLAFDKGYNNSMSLPLTLNKAFSSLRARKTMPFIKALRRESQSPLIRSLSSRMKQWNKFAKSFNCI